MLWPGYLYINSEVGTIMNKIKILIVAGSMEIGGIENQLMHLLRNADKDHFQIDFTTTSKKPYYRSEMERLGARCIQIPKTHDKLYIPYCKFLYQLLRKGQYDVVHSHELFHSGMVVAIARAAGVPHRFVHAHNWSDGNGTSKKTSLIRRIYNTVMQKSIRRFGTEFLACSTLAGKFLYGDYIVNQSNYHLIYNSVDTTKYLAHYDHVENGEFCEDGWINVLQVGRFTPIKNQLFTAQIAKELKRRGLKIRILCAGNNGNDYEAQVADAIKREQLEEHMLLLGIRNDIDVLARKCSAFLLPSLYEGMPLVLIEAQAAGLPCVIADTFSHEVDYGLGLIHWMPLEKSASDWADAVEAAVSTPRAPKADVVAAIEKGGFDSKIFAQKLCNLYETSVRKM